MSPPDKLEEAGRRLESVVKAITSSCQYKSLDMIQARHGICFVLEAKDLKEQLKGEISEERYQPITDLLAKAEQKFRCDREVFRSTRVCEVLYNVNTQAAAEEMTEALERFEENWRGSSVISVIRSAVCYLRLLEEDLEEWRYRGCLREDKALEWKSRLTVLIDLVEQGKRIPARSSEQGQLPTIATAKVAATTGEKPQKGQTNKCP